MGLIADVVRDVFEVPAPGPGSAAPVDAERSCADHLAAVTRSVMETGAVPIWPVPWNRVLRCARCGPVYWAAEGKVEGCPWCWIRADGFAVPKATAVSSVR